MFTSSCPHLGTFVMLRGDEIRQYLDVALFSSSPPMGRFR
jgi:hypothetical protein